jgi:hypothetical protein
VSATAGCNGYGTGFSAVVIRAVAFHGPRAPAEMTGTKSARDRSNSWLIAGRLIPGLLPAAEFEREAESATKPSP